MIGVAAGLRVGMDERGGQPRQCMQKIMLGADSDLVRLDCGSAGIDADLALSAQLMAGPAQPDLAPVQYARDRRHDSLDQRRGAEDSQ